MTLTLDEAITEKVSHDFPRCEIYMAMVSGGVIISQGERCPRAATHEVLRTCCGARTIACTEHAAAMSGALPDGVGGLWCGQCNHACARGVCCCRVVIPL